MLKRLNDHLSFFYCQWILPAVTETAGAVIYVSLILVDTAVDAQMVPCYVKMATPAKKVCNVGAIVLSFFFLLPFNRLKLNFGLLAQLTANYHE